MSCQIAEEEKEDGDSGTGPTVLSVPQPCGWDFHALSRFLGCLQRSSPEWIILL
ncbi:hypothetical protein THTE_4325 [Thermogutta terrifontis]|uniref:Uncharacterized protein n=1 Tax=Thermogutta terrifontis TaxID=1331910 RepID=A0A286RLT4_9BACT|nr:hypothetical protein THTE_4325 [Thermogutta terrifontis]